MQSFRLSLLACLALCALACAPMDAGARQRSLAGPVEAQAVRVIDGDTFVADVAVWPGQTIRVSVRIRGIDAPEIHSRCAREREAGERSRAALQAMLGEGAVTIANVGGGKYYGRVLADVSVAGRPVAQRLLRRDLARPYGGGTRVAYCR